MSVLPSLAYTSAAVGPSLSPLPRALALAGEVAGLLADAQRTARVRFLATLDRCAGSTVPLRELRAAEDEAAAELAAALAPVLDAAWAELTELDAALTGKERGVAQATWRAEVLPFFLGVPLVRRSMDKPLGYAGDYGMVRMIFEQPEDPGNALGRALTRYIWGVGPCRAHRQRRPWAIEHLRALRARLGRPLRIVSYACGPEHTLQAWLQEDPTSTVYLYDAEPKALEHCEERFRKLAASLGRPLDVHTRQVTARELVSGEADLDEAQGADAVLVLGLFDYLTPETIVGLTDRLASLLRPGGRLLCTNLHTVNPWRAFMEYVGYWQVIHRSVDDLAALAVHGRPDLALVDARTDDSGTNVFVTVERHPGL